MAQTDDRLHHDFRSFLSEDTPGLLAALAETHEQLANLSVMVAFLKQEEVRQTPGAKEQRLEAEGLRDAYVERKWLLKTLLEHREVER